MKAEFWQKGETLDYVNEGTKVIEAGEIVDFKTRIGVAAYAINPKEKGTVHVVGVYIIKKKDQAEIKLGAPVYFAEDGITATAGSNTPASYAAETSPVKAADIRIKLLG